MIKGIYGINIAVKNLDAAVQKYEKVFDIKSEPLMEKDFAFPGLIGAKLNIGGTVINLISYTQDGTSVGGFIDKKGEGLFLISVEVDDIENDVKELQNRGLNFILKDTLSGNYGKVNFVHPKSMHGVQIEVYQPQKD
jgi:methylmalonyl-CoA epimerase